MSNRGVSSERRLTCEVVQTLADRPYDRWLRRLLEHIITFSSNKDKAFTQFMIDLPEIPREEIARLGEMCLNPDQYACARSTGRTWMN